ncbi:MAG: response regulator [Coprococcus sp.]
MKTKAKIMIVDDAEMNREILMVILGDEYEYVQAENGRQAIHILQQDMNIDLMLLDINMPEMNGFQVLDRMNTFHWINDIPVIMISSEEKKDVIERAYILGAEDYIRRPFDAFIVRRRVQNILNLYANQKRLMQMGRSDL